MFRSLSRKLTSGNAVFCIGLYVTAVLLQARIQDEEQLIDDAKGLGQLRAGVVVHIVVRAAREAAVD